MSITATILQSNYVPWRGYFDLIQRSDYFIFYDEVKYTKNDWRNRNRVASKDKSHWITIPVDKSSERVSINSVLLDYDKNWRKSHLSLIEFCYKKAPKYKSQLKPIMEHWLYELKTNSLSELNQYSITHICKEASINTCFIKSESISTNTGRIERLLSILEYLNATKYLCGPSAKTYMDTRLDDFSNKGIEVIFYKYGTYKTYDHSNNYYDNFLSILDFLANEDIKNLSDFLNTTKNNYLV
jgi:hypothetical protein